MARSLSDRTRDLIVQSVLIVFSVLLALFLNELWGNHEQAQQRDQVVANVVAELQDNAESLEAVMGHHEAASIRLLTYLDSLDRVGGQIDEIPIRALGRLGAGGIREPVLQQTAWESAQLSAAYDLLPYEMAYGFARLYDLQEDGVQRMWRHLAGLMISVEAQKPGETVPMLRSFGYGFGQLHSQEEYLLYETQELIEEVCADTAVPTCE